jgi:hypothetical protein
MSDVSKRRERRKKMIACNLVAVALEGSILSI